MAAILAACARPGIGALTKQEQDILDNPSRPDNPQLLPLYRDPIPTDTPIERNATLQVYNWADYLWPKFFREFEDKYSKYDVKVELTTFNDISEGIQKITSGQVAADVFFPDPSWTSRLVIADLLRPLNHELIPNLPRYNWKEFQNPFYDQKWRYTVPYTIYTTGIAYRRDHIPDETIDSYENTYDILWDPKYKGKVRSTTTSARRSGMALLRNGVTDVNTGNAADIATAKDDILDCIDRTNAQLAINGIYTKLPQDEVWVGSSWSGDILAAYVFYLPKGTSPSVLGFWYPKGGGGMIGNDTIIDPHGRQEPAPGARVPELHARQGHLLLELRELQRLPDAAELDQSRHTRSGRHPGEPRRDPRAARVLRRRALPPGTDAAGERPVERRLGRDQSRWIAAPSRSSRDEQRPTKRKKAASLTRDSGVRYPRWYWPSFAAPSIIYLLVLFILPFYVVFAVAFGTVDIFQNPVPVYQPWYWTTSTLTLDAWTGSSGPRRSTSRPSSARSIYVPVASLICLVLGYTVAYFVARYGGRRKNLYLVLLIAPFWISYLMRIYAWQGLLVTDGLINKILIQLHLISTPVAWLQGKPVTVILGLVYGYIPYMVLPIYGQLDRIDKSMLEAGRDLGASPFHTFRRVTLPLSRQAILAGLVIVSLPMFGDYFTNNLLGSTKTSMYGNLIDNSLTSPGGTAQAACLVLILMILLLIPLWYYLRATKREAETGMSTQQQAKVGRWLRNPWRKPRVPAGRSRGATSPGRSCRW